MDNEHFRFPNPVPKEYVPLYLAGNSLWPQMHLVSSHFIAAELMKARSKLRFTDLIEKQLSRDQVSSSGDTLNALHAKYGIVRRYNKGQVSQDHDIRSYEVHLLWDGAVFEAVDRVVAYGKMVQPAETLFANDLFLRQIKYLQRPLAKDYVKQIDAWLSSHPRDKSIIRSFFAQSRDFFLGEDFKNRANIFRELLAMSPNSSERLIQVGNVEMRVEEYTQQEAWNLVMDLAAKNPEYNWLEFTGVY